VSTNKRDIWGTVATIVVCKGRSQARSSKS
jgi:hypothetical protein